MSSEYGYTILLGVVKMRDSVTILNTLSVAFQNKEGEIGSSGNG